MPTAARTLIAPLLLWAHCRRLFRVSTVVGFWLFATFGEGAVRQRDWPFGDLLLQLVVDVGRLDLASELLFESGEPFGEEPLAPFGDDSRRKRAVRASL